MKKVYSAFRRPGGASVSSDNNFRYDRSIDYRFSLESPFHLLNATNECHSIYKVELYLHKLVDYLQNPDDGISQTAIGNILSS